MWASHGRKVHQQDPSYTLVINLSESPTVFSTEFLEMPEVIVTLLEKSLEISVVEALQQQAIYK